MLKIKSLKVWLRQFSVNLSLNNGIIALELKGKEIMPLFVLQKVFYFILNFFESKYFVKIMNFPYCLLPEAQDHVHYEKTEKRLFKKGHLCPNCMHHTFCHGVKKNIPVKHFPLLPVSHSLQDIVFELNNACNLNCKFCFYRHKDGTELSFKKIDLILNEAKSLGVRSVRFTGGEPFLRKDIFNILRLAKSKGFYIFLNTNASLLNGSAIKELEKYVDNILISLNAYCKASKTAHSIENRFFEEKIKNIIKLKYTRIPHVRVGSIITRPLLNNFEKYRKLIMSMEVSVWEFYRPMLPKAMVEHSTDYKIEKSDILALLKYIEKLSISGVDAYIANAVPFCITNNNRYRIFLRGAQFDDGHSRLVIDAQGFFKPSYSIDLNLGSSISRALQHAFIKNLHTFNYLSLKCKRCIYMRWCLGGSRYMAHEYSGDYFAQDPLMKS